jgi:SSS family solute:Na+ symporter
VTLGLENTALVPASQKLLLPDQIVVGAYLLAVVGMGAYFVRRSRTVEGFSVGSRSMPGWALGLSILGTYLSSITFLAYASDAYTGGWSRFVFSLTIPVACLVATLVFIPLYRRKLRISAYQYLEERFHPWARSYTALSFVLLQISRVGAVLYYVAVALSEFIGIEVSWIIVVLGIAVTVYTVLGGIEGVVWTDVVQVFVLLGGALACVGILLFRMPEGPGQIFSMGREAHKFGLGGWSANLALPTFWVIFIYGIVENLKNFGIDQNHIQRYLAARSDREAKKALWTGGLIYVPVSALFLFIGTALFAYYSMHKGELPADLQDPANANRIFPFFIVTRLPVGVRGLLIAAVLAAAMSSVDSSLNSSATVSVVDFYRRYFRRNADDAQLLLTMRIVTVVLGVLGTIAALAMIKAQSALDVWWQVSAIFGGGMLGLFLLGLVVKRASHVSALVGVCVNLAVICWATFARGLPAGWSWLECPFHELLTGLLGAGSLIVVGLASTLLIRKQRQEGVSEDLRERELE